MEETIKIGGEFKEGYMGGTAWTGTNYHGYMRYSEINKIVKKAFREKFPNVKVSCTGSSFSGGQECVGTVFAKLSDAVCSLEEFVKKAKETNFCPNSTWYYVEGQCVFHESPTLTYDMKLECVYKSYVKCLLSYSGGSAERFDKLDELILNPEIIEQCKYLNALYDSFNDYDVNGMVDYFDVMFYKNIHLKCIEE